MHFPTLTRCNQLFSQSQNANCLHVYRKIHSDLITPVHAYLTLTQLAPFAFLLESVAGGERIGRFSFLGQVSPDQVLRTGPKETVQGDPLVPLKERLAKSTFPDKSLLTKEETIPAVFRAGAVGFISFDCVEYFEPRTKQSFTKSDDVAEYDADQIPESVFMFCDHLVIFDHLMNLVYLVATLRKPVDGKSMEDAYALVCNALDETAKVLLSSTLPCIPQHEMTYPAPESATTYVTGEDRYKHFVTTLKQHICKGDIIQAVPSQRVLRRTLVHPFNLYRQLRTMNPSPYMFYVDLEDVKLIGASPEMLVSVIDGRVVTHPIAGTRKRGETVEQDQQLEQELLQDEKERAEHVMLVDLGRNDVNRVCQPRTVTVDSLMHVERYSHVMHIVSQVSGTLRAECDAFDAFKSIFPAGTVSGAPKIRAVELVRGLEGEKRGIYAGALGWFDYHGNLDTCIAIRTMLWKRIRRQETGEEQGVVVCQAGGGIVYDSREDEEWQETRNKMQSSINCIDQAECYYASVSL